MDEWNTQADINIMAAHLHRMNGPLCFGIYVNGEYLFQLSWILKLVAIHISVLIIARVCSGFVLGGCYCLIPMYVREISQDSIKGKMVSLAILMQHVGVLAMYALGSYLEYYTSSWILLSISLVTLLLMILAPESPVFLVKKGKDDVSLFLSFCSLQKLFCV